MSDFPVRGEDFCDRCGDCLACYGEENCYPDGSDHGDHVVEADDGIHVVPWRTRLATKAPPGAVKP